MMNLSRAPAFVAAKMAMLSDARVTAATRADELPAQISFVRDRLNGHVQRQRDDPVKLGIEFDRLLAEQKTLQRQRPIETDTIDRCKAWLAALPPATVLEQVAPVVEEGLIHRIGIIGEQAASVVHETTQPIASARNNARAALNFRPTPAVRPRPRRKRLFLNRIALSRGWP